jgi:hypothetical protein
MMIDMIELILPVLEATGLAHATLFLNSTGLQRDWFLHAKFESRQNVHGMLHRH